MTSATVICSAADEPDEPQTAYHLRMYPHARRDARRPFQTDRSQRDRAGGEDPSQLQLWVLIAVTAVMAAVVTVATGGTLGRPERDADA